MLIQPWKEYKNEVQLMRSLNFLKTKSGVIKMKKGFTIVELAIVLVVIGIILAMAIKGKSLVDAARFRAEINKLRKLEAAMHIYIANHPDFVITDHGYAYVAWADMDMNYFYDNGILAKKDLESMAIEGIAGRNVPGFWTPVGCQYTDGAIEFHKGDNQVNPFKATNYCARIFVDVVTSPTLSTMTYVKMPARIQCGIEVILDDENIETGVARRTENHVFPNYTRAEYDDCMALSMQEPSDRDMGVVMY